MNASGSWTFLFSYAMKLIVLALDSYKEMLIFNRGWLFSLEITMKIERECLYMVLPKYIVSLKLFCYGQQHAYVTELDL